MKSRTFVVGALLALGMGLNASAFAGAKDYAFEPVKAEIKQGSDAVVAVRLVHKPSGKPVPDAVLVSTRIDMGPDGMPTMTTPLAPLPGQEAGVYAFKAKLPMEGQWQLSIAAKVQGEPETVVSRLIIKATE